MNALRVSWLFFKLGVLNELQYRVNFFVSLLQSAIALVVGAGRARARLLAHGGAERLVAVRASLRPRHPDPHGRAIKTYIQPNMTRLIEDVREGSSTSR